jgi:hypothetical protein
MKEITIAEIRQTTMNLPRALSSLCLPHKKSDKKEMVTKDFTQLPVMDNILFLTQIFNPFQ